MTREAGERCVDSGMRWPWSCMKVEDEDAEMMLLVRVVVLRSSFRTASCEMCRPVANAELSSGSTGSRSPPLCGEEGAR